MTPATSSPPSLPLATLVALLDAELRLDLFPQDDSHNGLQVACSDKPIRRICCGVDASLPFFEAAAAWGADLLICHHGLSWGSSLKRITGLNYRQLEFLIRHDLALWACHLPLDAHARLGNNAQLAQALKLRRLQPFGVYRGTPIGFAGELARPMSFDNFADRLQQELGRKVASYQFGSALIRSVGIVSGGAADSVSEAAARGLDAFVTGEPSLVGYNLSQQLGVNSFYGGHYATERYGVAAIGKWLQESHGLTTTFIDLNLPF